MEDDAILPFSWTMRVSKRAKYPRISVNATAHVELVWPKGLSQQYIQSTLRRFEPWVLKRISSLNLQTIIDKSPPVSVCLPSIHQHWTITYQHHTDHQPMLKSQGQTMLVVADLNDPKAVRTLLLDWLKAQARLYLPEQLAAMAQVMGLNYARVSIRLQKKRWGSCSSKKNINLNAALLFLSPVLLRHVLIHELAHLQHMNHSPAFWAVVSRFDEAYLEHRRLLRHAGQTMPYWLEYDLDNIAMLDI